MAIKKRIIRNGYVAVVTDEMLSTATVEDYRYEHRIVAEELLGRELRPNEEVHHLDLNKQNNSPDNLLVLEDTQHIKLHKWLDNNIIIPKIEYAERKQLGCVRCLVCEKPIPPENKYCSKEHSDIGRRITVRPPIDVLKTDKEKMSFVSMGEKYGVSDKTVSKWCKQAGIVVVE